MTDPARHAPADLCCPGCGATLGQSTPGELRAGTVVLRHATTFYCPACGRRAYWRPLRGHRSPPRDTHGPAAEN